MSEVDRPTQKAEHRGERLLWSGSADAIVERKLRKEAEQECKEQLRALGECIKQHTFTLGWKCKPQRDEVRSCFHQVFDSDRRVDYELEEKQRRLNKLKELTEKKKNAGVE